MAIQKTEKKGTVKKTAAKGLRVAKKTQTAEGKKRKKVAKKAK